MPESGDFSVCHAGVAEYVFPIRRQEKYYGLVFAGCAVSEFGAGAEVLHAAGDGAERLKKLYGALAGVLPEKEKIAAFVNPLLYMPFSTGCG